MTQLFDFLDTEVAKYRDIGNILTKLKDGGEIQTMYDFFKNVFTNEFKFTLQELLRIEEETQEKIDMEEQCKENLSLFKNNFLLIMQMTFDRAFRAATKENHAKLAEKGYVEHDVTIESASIANISDQATTTSKNTKVKKNRSKSKRVSSPNQSNVGIEGKAKTKKNSSSKSIRNSNISSPLARILGTNSSTHFMGESTTTFQKSRKNSINQQLSMINTRSTRSILNKSHMTLQSEFNYIRGPATIPKSPKETDSRTVSPGPAAYKVEASSFRQSPSPTIDRASKKSWFDEVAGRNVSPGPARHSGSHHFISK